MTERVTIRALLQIDRLQPRFAAYNGATVQGRAMRSELLSIF